MNDSPKDCLTCSISLASLWVDSTWASSLASSSAPVRGITKRDLGNVFKRYKGIYRHLAYENAPASQPWRPALSPPVLWLSVLLPPAPLLLAFLPPVLWLPALWPPEPSVRVRDDRAPHTRSAGGFAGGARPAAGRAPYCGPGASQVSGSAYSWSSMMRRGALAVGAITAAGAGEGKVLFRGIRAQRSTYVRGM